MHTPESSCMTDTSLQIKNMRIKQLFNKVQGFAIVLRARKDSGAYDKRVPGLFFVRAFRWAFNIETSYNIKVDRNRFFTDFSLTR